MNDGDVGVVQGCEGSRFALEARQPLGVLCERFRQELDSDLSPECRIGRPIYLTHASRADWRD